MGVALDPMKWAKQEFDSCDLGDVRRTRRLVKLFLTVCSPKRIWWIFRLKNYSVLVLRLKLMRCRV